MSDIVIRQGGGSPVQVRAGFGSPISINIPPITPPGENIVTDQLLLYLDAANASSYPGTGTTWTDLSGNGNNFNLVNGPSFISNGNASTFYFNADSFQHAASTTSINLQRDFTLEAWINANWFGTRFPTNNRGIFGQGIAGGSQAIAIFAFDNGYTFSMYANDVSAISPNSTGTWYHVAFTYSNTSYNKGFYKNGSSLGSFSGGQYLGSPGTFRIAAPYGALNQEMFEGNIALARVYTKVLSSTEIAQNYNAQKTRYGY